MKIDLYTRSVLTVIALCLVWVCAADAGIRVEARQEPADPAAPGEPQPVVIVGWGTLDAKGRVNIVRNGGTTDPAIPVKVTAMPADPLEVRLPYSPGLPLPIEISRINQSGIWQPIRVSVEDEPLQARPGR